MNRPALVASIVGTALISVVLLFAVLLAIQNTSLVVYVQNIGGQAKPLGTSPWGRLGQPSSIFFLQSP